jgi:hypothetical protein
MAWRQNVEGKNREGVQGSYHQHRGLRKQERTQANSKHMVSKWKAGVTSSEGEGPANKTLLT